MSANAAIIPRSAPIQRPTRKLNMLTWAGSIVVALGLGAVLAGASASDVTDLSDAFGAPVETVALPAQG